MRHSSIKMIAGLFATVSMFAVSANAQGVEAGVNGAVRNDVTVQSEGDASPRAAVPAGKVYMGDVVRSGADSALQVLLLDETVFTLGQNAEVEIDEFVYDPATNDGTISATVKKGAFRFMSGRIATANPTKVSMTAPNANIGIRGTVLDIVVGSEAVRAAQASGMGEAAGTADENATLVILRGPGREQTGINKDGGAYVNSGGDEATLWKSGTAVFVPRSGGDIFGPFRLNQGFELSFAPQGGKGRTSGSAGRPPRDVRDVTRGNPDLRDRHRPPRPGGPRRPGCFGECPNDPEEGSQSDISTFDDDFGQ